ncbi:MAG: ferredoxin [Myxococcales bacterium]|nr:ferredoxin [Myxococcales bacterium]
MALRVEADRDSCQSSGRCVQAAPEAFGLDADHLVTLADGVDALPDERKRAIARDCPALAIHLYDAEGREVDPD